MDVRDRYRSAELGALIYRQDGVVSRAQLRTLGIDRFAVRNEVRALRWRCVGTRVVVLHRGPLTFRQRCWVAVLHAGSGALIAGRSALRLGGMRREQDIVIEVVVPRSVATAPPLPGVRVRRGSRPSPSVGSPPRQPPAEAAMHAARRAPDLAVAAGLLASVVQQRLAGTAQLREALDRDRSIRGHAILRAIVDDIEGGAHALGELGLGAICRHAGVRSPRRQQVRRDPDGRRRYLDAVVAGVVVEVDGAPHLDVVQQTDDCFRQNERTIGREAVLRFTSLAVRTQPDRVADQLRRAISAGLAREPERPPRPTSAARASA